MTTAAEKKAAAAAAAAAASTKPKAFDPANVKRTKIVSLPTLSVMADKAIYVHFETAVQTRVINEGKDNERTFQFAQVTDHVTGELMNLNVDNGILWSFDANYENDEYVNKSFEIVGFKEQGKRYMKFRISEIEV